MKSVDGYDSGVKKALSGVKGHLVGRLQFAHPKKLPECCRSSAAIRVDPHVGTFKH
jgi:hypothetical protein